MRDFYVENFGFEIEWEPDSDNVYLTSGSDNIALHRTAIGIGRETVLDHIGFLVGHANDVDGWAEYLKARGVALISEPRTHRDGARSCYLSDPEGNKVQIIYHPPISKELS
tara:strand:+ start:38648 stop:38980 length:333 start_codon:yes stop_codon:yes gene_type:complete